MSFLRAVATVPLTADQARMRLPTTILIAHLFCSICVTAARAASPDFQVPHQTHLQLRGLGVVAKLGESAASDDAKLKLIEAMGVNMVIWTPGEWANNETFPGRYALSPEVRRVLGRIKTDGLQTVVVLFRKNMIYKNPLDPEAYARYCAWMANKLQEFPIAAYEIWNEPSNFDVREYYGGAWNGRDNALWVSKFEEMMRMAAKAIKQANPRSVAIVNLEGPPLVYAMREAPSNFSKIDGVAFHPYPGKLPAESVPWGGMAIFLRDGVSTADPDGSLASTLRIQAVDDPEKYLNHPLQKWVTEYGFPTCDPSIAPQHFACVTPDVQAAYCVRGLILGFAQGVRLWALYELADEGDNRTDVEQNFGLVKSTSQHFAPKPAFYAVQNTARLLGRFWTYHPACPAVLQRNFGETLVPIANASTTSGPQVFCFRTPGTWVVFVWNAGDYGSSSSQVQMKWSGHTAAGLTIRAINLVSGKSLSAAVMRDNHRLIVGKIPLGSEPIAIQLATDTSTESASGRL